jgi:excinuclease UvrABC nuclease subunit
MSFATCAARSFTIPSILKNAPEQPGIYGICNQQEWIFIAEAVNIQASLLEQLRAVQSAVSLRKPTGFTFEVCSYADAAGRKQMLVSQFKPSCNSPDAQRRSKR